jgi:anti-sigma B factor antagonist
MEPMTAACHQFPSVTVIKVCAELDLMTADAFQEHSLDVCGPGDHVVLDLSETTFMDCSGIRALLRVHEHVCTRGGSVQLCGPQPGPAKIISITHIDKCLPTHTSLEEAVRTGLAVAEGTAHSRAGDHGSVA